MQETTNKRGRKSEIDKMKAQISNMERQQETLLSNINKLMALLGNSKIETKEEDEEVELNNIDTKVYKEDEDNTYLEQPKSDELIRVCSLTHGELNLSVGGRVAISFRKYGDIKPVLYSSLVNIVNENRGFAEYGDFYIMDKRAVYHLGLTEYYKKIYPIEVLNDIDKYSTDNIEKILNNMCNQQKETVVINVAKKIYEDKTINQNSVKTIEKILDVDIHNIVRTMREIDENLK